MFGENNSSAFLHAKFEISKGPPGTFSCTNLISQERLDCILLVPE
jgi:hypothetical protein